MMRLTREIRFPLDAGRAAGSEGVTPYVLRATVSGPVDPLTGYVCNAAVLDAVLRDPTVVTVFHQWIPPAQARPSCERLLVHLRPVVAKLIPAGVSLLRIELDTAACGSYSVETGVPGMISVTRRFEFAAGHRLWSSKLDDDENRKVFGRCSNQHGHNYVLDVTVSGEPDPTGGMVIEPADFDQIVTTRVLDALDHKNLNEDCEEFTDLNPSAENIARVVWNRLDGRFGRARLTSVRVHETPRTCAEYRGP